ncbi:glycoside hydrolase family 130 protein [Flavilitoribacter nigricans]|uniref:Glycosidase n=1 Tax=Flavilitoribacter nigricans (strain ATCC 23147 / DSM 23189 / NBRC 102662 / NCIMB 1420 / SS-2) TaxID=1122177 RepID=A0A2D0NAI9_FLAN2|nr:glycoside hydrolase family 130 protein [Flavilitoribacter nigricans]PHN05524.1 glycosidase [Flavilitoribacter nigricans DSM 23189 = NBRC 102662]
MKIPVKRKSLRIPSDMTRVIARFFYKNDEQARILIAQVLRMDDALVATTLNQVLRDFAWRHRNVTEIFERHFKKVSHLLKDMERSVETLSESQRLLIGAYFTHEYSIESAAFFNPSLIVSPDQSGLAEGELRVIASMRATGEGHISSIEFRHLTIDQHNELYLAPPANRLEEAEVIQEHIYQKTTFANKLREMQLPEQIFELIINELPETFNYNQLRDLIHRTRETYPDIVDNSPEAEEILWLAEAHHELKFSRDTDISERVIFPHSAWESRGIEDARFVRFVYPDGRVAYYATYTAYDGYTILPKLIYTEDFLDFKVKPIYGEGAQNKNLALFPRQVNGQYVMLARIDGTNNYIMFSDRLTVWENPKLLQTPVHPWELVQIGNCGSPIETDQGWLLITHGVGPMRRYSLGACLLDLDDPSKVIARLEEPLLYPNEEEREGYVPNVVYSCGSIISHGELIVPYAMSDYASTFMSVPLDQLLDKLVRG